MRGPHNIWRLIRAGATFERTGAMRTLLDLIEAPRAIRILARGFGAPFQILGLRGDATHPPMLRAIIALGPAYIKFGQLLSTRPDVVGVALAEELKILQDRLPAFAQDIADCGGGKGTGDNPHRYFHRLYPACRRRVHSPSP